jgi:peptide/nickel transport system substrate-binding protein
MPKCSTAALRRRAITWSAVLCCALSMSSCGRRGQQQKAGTDARTLNYTLGNDISQMDPALITDIESGLVASQVYQGLVRFRDDSVEIEHDLAEKYEVSDDGLVWTFQLRKDVTFHDGTPFDAGAVVFSVMRQMDDHHPYHVPGKMRYAKMIYGDRTTTETELVREVSAPDSHTVVFTLAKPFTPFIKNLAMTPAAIVSPKAVETYGKDFQTTMVGTGPFRLKSHKPDELLVLQRNETFWGEKARLQEIRFRILRNADIRLNSLRKGESDIISAVEPTAIEMLEKEKDITVISEPSMSIGYIAMNCSRTPFDNKLVRQAFNYAIDKEYIVKNLYLNRSVVAKGLIPPGMLGYNPDRTGYPYDQAKAKQLLSEAGYPNGFTITFTTHNSPRVYNPVGAKLAERIQQDLQKVGVTVKIEQLEFSAFLDKQKAGEYQISNGGWVSDNGDPDNFIFELAGREDNEAKYVNAEATSLMRAAAEENDEKKREEMYRKAEDMIVENPPFVFLNHSKQVLALRKSVRNFKAHPTAVAHLSNVDVDRQ